jgi:hypothetical protein
VPGGDVVMVTVTYQFKPAEGMGHGCVKERAASSVLHAVLLKMLLYVRAALIMLMYDACVKAVTNVQRSSRSKLVNV